MRFLKYIVTLVIVLLPLSADAQFFVTGDDPGRLKWQYIDTDNYQIIFPEGNDSLARVYGENLEKYRIPISRTAGYLPGGPGKKRMPVVLHTHNAQANGSVAWAPKRMDLYTIPSAYNPEPLPWTKMLAIHESRHVAQMQFAMTGVLKPGNWFFGEMWNIAFSLIYPGMDHIEGDAVIMETALTKSGRGRTADFLNYYRIAFDNDVKRSWAQWRHGSQRNYTPNYYAVGYLNLAGIRHIYGSTYFGDDASHYAARHPNRLRTFNRVTESISGKKYKENFTFICDSLGTYWKSEIASRAPFIPMEEVTEEPRLYTNYRNSIFIGDDIYAIKSGYLTSDILVRIDKDGKEHTVSRFAHETGMIYFDPSLNRIYWSETLPDERWSMSSESKIRYINLGVVRNDSTTIEVESYSRKRSFKNDRLLYNPAPSEDGFTAAVQYHIKGGSSLVIIPNSCLLNKDYDKSRIKEIPAPDSLQLLEPVWVGETVYITALSDNGYGIYSFSKESDTISKVLPPQPVKIKNFTRKDEELVFTCDRTGTNEIYHFNPESGNLTQKTNTRYGVSDMAYSPDGEYLYFSAETLKGKRIYKTHRDSLLNRPADFTVLHKYILAESITNQEDTAVFRHAEDYDYAISETYNGTSFSEPKKYSKFGHAFNMHSWAPVYVSVDNIMNMSFDRIYQAASLGVSGIMQNRLSTGVGEFGYSAHKDPYDKSKWRHSGHLKYTYSGLYPVFEFAIDFNDRAARQYQPKVILRTPERGSLAMYSNELSIPYFEGRASVYIPFDFSSGGWFKGLIPKVTYTINNDRFNTSMMYLPLMLTDVGPEEIPLYSEGKISPVMQRISGSIRGYSVLSTPNSAVYPKWGIGFELGGSSMLQGREFYSPMGYAYAYGYVPGIVPSQGLKLSAMHQQKLNKNSYFGQTIVNIAPRGLSDNGNLSSYFGMMCSSATKLSADYAIPIYIGDVGIGGGFFYIKRLVLTPHFDYTFFDNGSLYSGGADLTISLNSILWLGWPCSVGVTYSYNGGASFDSLNAQGFEMGHHFVGPLFSVSF